MNDKIKASFVFLHDIRRVEMIVCKAIRVNVYA